jgi:hypothetical protein
MTNILIINGMHRSGTTLLSRLVNALPDTFIIKDGIRIPLIYFRVETNERFVYPRDCYRKPPLEFNLDRPVKDISHLGKILLEDLDANKLLSGCDLNWENEMLKFKQGDSYKKIFLHFFSWLAKSKNVQCVGAKNTNMFQYSSTLLTTFPNLKWIDIIRDSRGWYGSSKVSHYTNVFYGAILWNKAVKNILIRRNLKQDLRICISFEELVLSREKTLRKICKLLGVNFEVTEDWIETLRLTENDGSPWLANSSYTKNGEWAYHDVEKQKKMNYQVLDTVPVYRWKKTLSVWEKVLLRIITGKNLKLLNFIN